MRKRLVPPGTRRVYSRKVMRLAREATSVPAPPMLTPTRRPRASCVKRLRRIAAGTLLMIWQVRAEISMVPWDKSRTNSIRTALALAFSYLENFFPLSLAIPIPGIKLGLANIVTVFALYALGPAQALLILTGRCLLGAVFAGNMNALIFSLLGGFSAMLVMILLSRSRHLSIYGVSIGGAAAHNCGQIAAACLTLGSMAPLYYLPILLGASLITGAVTGVAAACLFRALVHTNILR